MVEHIEHIALEDRISFYKIAKENYGRAALCLSGGAKMAFYHFGIIKALLLEQLLPNLISGTSGGALVAAFVCVRTSDELLECLNSDIYQYFTSCNESFLKKLSRLIRTGHVFCVDD